MRHASKPAEHRNTHDEAGNRQAQPGQQQPRQRRTHGMPGKNRNERHGRCTRTTISSIERDGLRHGRDCQKASTPIINPGGGPRSAVWRLRGCCPGGHGSSLAIISLLSLYSSWSGIGSLKSLPQQPPSPRGKSSGESPPGPDIVSKRPAFTTLARPFVQWPAKRAQTDMRPKRRPLVMR